MNKKKGIGELLIRLRKEAGFTLKEMSEGIWSVSELGKIEQNKYVPGHFQLDRLFERMGKTTERLEYVLPKEVYEIYELRYLIQTAICHLDFEEAERLLLEYENKKQAKRPLHRQFVEQQRAQIAWIRGESTETVLELINAAIGWTMALEGAQNSTNALSADELKLLLFRWEVSKGTPYGRPTEEIREVMRYIERHSFDAEEKVRVYPYVVLLLVGEMDMDREWHTMEEYLETALELLREEGKILYMPEILERYAQHLDYRKQSGTLVRELLSQRKSLLALEEEFNIHLEKYPLFHHLNRVFELDYEMIRQERKVSGISQFALSDEICTPEELSRIETGKRTPSSQNMEELLRKLERERTRINPIITTDEYEVIALEKEIARTETRFEKEKREKLLSRLKSRIDINIPENKQYIMLAEMKSKAQNNLLSYEERIKRLYEILSMTLDEKKDVFAYRLTHVESNILNRIAREFECNQNKEKAIDIWRKLLQNYEESRVHPAFRIRDWELVTGNLAGTMEELDILKEPLEFCERRLEVALSVGKGNEIGRAVVIIACVLWRKHDMQCISCFRQALDIMKLMKMDYRYQCVKEFVEKQGLLEKI